jgi:hypothetical protein
MISSEVARVAEERRKEFCSTGLDTLRRKNEKCKRKMKSGVTICTVVLSGGTITPVDGADCTGPKQARVFP